ncbi:MAG: GTP-binding protein, partial [Desulfobulbaceae bacterium]|nr:GTP-binding protein [Desulfobulbaceae bacterium]
SQILQGENVSMVELDGGCVCCELTGEFEAAVEEVIKTVRPEIIVVEVTGVAEADALVYEVEDNLPQVRLDCVVSSMHLRASGILVWGIPPGRNLRLLKLFNK